MLDLASHRSTTLKRRNVYTQVAHHRFESSSTRSRTGIHSVTGGVHRNLHIREFPLPCEQPLFRSLNQQPGGRFLIAVTCEQRCNDQSFLSLRLFG